MRAIDNPGRAICPGLPLFRVDKGGVEPEDGWPFSLRTGFTPIIGPFPHLSTTFAWVVSGEYSSRGSACPDDRTGGWGDGDLDLDDRTDAGGRC